MKTFFFVIINQHYIHEMQNSNIYLSLTKYIIVIIAEMNVHVYHIPHLQII